MRVSISIGNYSWGDAAAIRGTLGDLAVAADQAGVHTIWLPDHLIQADPRSSPDAEILETYTTLGYLAARTERVRLGAMVTPVSYRWPAAVVKAVTTLDVLSGGRAWFGVGAGYSDTEAKMMGLPFPTTGERFGQLEETLRIAARMWAGDESAFAGTHYSLERPINSPQSLQRPHPPVLVGGAGEKKTLPLVARYADACNLFDIPDQGATIRRKLAVLAEHCAAVGRDFDDIEKTVSTHYVAGESPDEFAERVALLRDHGTDHPVLLHNWTAADLDGLGKLIAA